MHAVSLNSLGFEVLNVLLCHFQVLSHTFAHLAQQFLVLPETRHQKFLLLLQLRGVKNDLRAHLMQLALLLEAFDQPWHIFEGAFHTTACCVQLLDQLFRVTVALFALVCGDLLAPRYLVKLI